MKIIFFISSFFLVLEGHGQKTPTDVGGMAFYCFQHNRLDSLFKLIPSLQELQGFARELGIAEGSDAYKAFLNRYPLVIKSFKDKCYQIQRDSLEYKFSWVNAKLEKIEPIEKTIAPENVPNKKSIVMTAVNVYFSSRGQSYILKFGDLHQYGGPWKSGNNISLTIQYQ